MYTRWKLTADWMHTIHSVGLWHISNGSIVTWHTCSSTRTQVNASNRLCMCVSEWVSVVGGCFLCNASQYNIHITAVEFVLHRRFSSGFFVCFVCATVESQSSSITRQHSNNIYVAHTHTARAHAVWRSYIEYGRADYGALCNFLRFQSQ